MVPLSIWVHKDAGYSLPRKIPLAYVTKTPSSGILDYDQAGGNIVQVGITPIR
jgi:hypothetical protein